MCLTTAECVANNIEPDMIPHSVASDQGLGCLLRPVCVNTGTQGKIWNPEETLPFGQQLATFSHNKVSNWQLSHCNKAQTTAG